MNMYFLDNAQGLNTGKMVIGWKEIGIGSWYYFAEDGKMLMNSVTPDGSTVGADCGRKDSQRDL